jgi:hypothetical protein
MDWTNIQKQTAHHKLAITLFPIIIFLAYVHPAIYIIGLIAFCLITSFKLLKKMLLWMLVLGGFSFLFPFLAPIIFIIMVVFFILRIGYVITNWKPFLSGVFLYGLSGILITRSFILEERRAIYLEDTHFVEAIVISFLGFLLLRSLLLMLYKNGYSSYAALGIMGSVPIIMISFILPFLKLHIGGDLYSADGYGHPGAGHTGGVDGANGTYPGTHSTHAYYRTAPDGDPTNNLSYHGSNPSPINSDMVHVRGYIATNPDGDLTNNFSYHGHDNHSAPYIQNHHAEVAAGKETPNSYPQNEPTLLQDVQAAIPSQVAVDRVISELKKKDEE